MSRSTPRPALPHLVRLPAILAVLAVALCSLTSASAAEPDYHTYDELFLQLNQLAQAHPAIAKIVYLEPVTEQSRHLVAIKISDNVDLDEDENRVLIVGAHHAREWISVEMPFLLAKNLVDSYGIDPRITDMVNHEEIWIIPVANPDGFTFTEIPQNRLWRKNRRYNSYFCSLFDTGWGVDLNRNYGSTTWGTINDGSTSSLCWLNTFRGPEGFSEPETQAIRDLMSEHEFVAVLSYHSFSQRILYPWGFTFDPVPNPDDARLMSTMARDMEQQIEAVPGAADYKPQQSAELYPTAGDLTDWTYEAFGIPSFTIELRPDKENEQNWGFTLPADQIEPTWAENKPAALYLIDTFNLRVAKPTQLKPANAGPADRPTKIRVTVTGLWRNLRTTDFRVAIGGLPAEVVLATRLPEVTADGGVQLGYELYVQPPVQQQNGIYDLQVRVGDADFLAPQAVVYGDASNVDVVLVIDRSGSMTGAPVADAKTAAKQFVDLMRAGDSVGVVSFSDYGVVDYALTAIAGTVKDDAKAAIDGIVAGGNTAIGTGLALAHSQLTTRGVPQHPWVAIVLSDGVSLPVGDVLDDLKAAGIVVYTIGLGSSIDEALLQDIAAQTGGSYYHAPTSEELAAIYAVLSTSVSGQQSLLALDASVQQDATDTQQVRVDATVSEATFAISWPGSDLDLTLTSPSGRLVDPAAAAADPAIEYLSSATYEYYRVQNPESGLWLMRTFGVAVTNGEEPYSVRVDARSELQMDLLLHGQARVGNPLRLEASLVDSQPVAGAQVWVDVVSPAATSVETIHLYDDGQHADGAAGDGVYANTLDQLEHAGFYEFYGYAAGIASAGDAFTRQVYRALTVEAAPLQTVDVSAPPDFSAYPGTVATATFTIRNTGSVAATYELVAGPVEDTQWAQLATLSDSIAVPSGGSQLVAIPLSIPPAADQPRANVLTLIATDQLDSEVSDSASVTVTAILPRADLSVTLEGAEVAAPGTEQDYAITVQNGGAATATDVFVTCETQMGMTIVSDSLGNADVISDTVRMWYLPTMQAGASAQIHVTLRLPDGSPTAGVLRIAAGTASGYTAAGPTVGVQDPDLLNNQAFLDVSLRGGPTRLCLPLITKRWPPIPDIPVLNPISNADGDGNYTVTWSPAYLAQTYLLQEDDTAAFSSPALPYSGSGTSWSTGGRAPGTYYYRVKASNSYGESDWSGIQQVTVVPPPTNVYVQNDTVGTLCYEIHGTGKGERCFSLGTSFYASFPSGTYSWRATAWCGTTSGTTYYAPGNYYHRFWCGLPQSALSGPEQAGDAPDHGEPAVLLSEVVGPSP